MFCLNATWKDVPSPCSSGQPWMGLQRCSHPLPVDARISGRIIYKPGPRCFLLDQMFIRPQVKIGRDRIRGQCVRSLTTCSRSVLMVELPYPHSRAGAAAVLPPGSVALMTASFQLDALEDAELLSKTPTSRTDTPVPQSQGRCPLTACS